MAPDDDDPVKVKRLLDWAAGKQVGTATDADVPDLDPATRAQLERWFGLPSFETVTERGDIPAEPPIDLEDPEVRAVRERRAKIVDEIDPVLLENHRIRVERGDTLVKFAATIDVHVDPSIARLDLGMIDRVGAIGDPREVEISDAVHDDLHECAPQALLRDLHRVETDFDKSFEILDTMSELKIDIVALVAEMMRTSLRLPTLDQLPSVEGRTLWAEIGQLKRVRITDIRMPNRTVKD